MLSKAKRTSVSSIITNAINSGVASLIPILFMKNFSPAVDAVNGSTFLRFLNIKDSFGLNSSPSDFSILNAVNNRNAPNK